MKFKAIVYDKVSGTREHTTVVADTLRDARETLQDKNLDILSLYPASREPSITRLRQATSRDTWLQELAMESAMLGEEMPGV